MANFLCALTLPDAVKQWSITTLGNQLETISAKIVRHGRSVTLQMAEVMVPRGLSRIILDAIIALRTLPPE